MKKTVCIIALITFIFVCAFSTYSPVCAATTPTFVVTCTSPKASDGIEQTKELILYYGVKDFTGFEGFENKGIDVFRGVLDFDTNVFEAIEIKLDSDEQFAGYATTTKDGSAPLQGQNGWGTVTYNPSTKKFELHSDSYVNSETVVLKVVLKVKGTAIPGNSSVTLRDIEAGNTGTDIYPSNSNNTVTTPVLVESLYDDPVGPFDPRTDLPEGAVFGGYLRLAPDTTVTELVSANSKMQITTVRDSSETTLSSNDYVPTGARTTVGELTYVFIVVGDMNSDGRLTAMDLSRLNALLTRQGLDLNDDQKRAADIRWDGELKASDLARLSSLITGLGSSKVSSWYGTGEKTCVPVTR